MECPLNWLEESSFGPEEELMVLEYENEAAPGTFVDYTKLFLSAAVDFFHSKWKECHETLSSIEKITRYKTPFNNKQKLVLLSLLRSSQMKLALVSGESPSQDWEADLMMDSEMSPRHKALVNSMKAYFLRHADTRRINEALKCAKEALRLDREEPIYAFVCGRILAEMRYMKVLPDVEKALRDEIAYYKIAPKVKEFYFIKVHLLVAYSDLSRHLYFKNKFVEDSSSSQMVMQLINECMDDEMVMNSIPLLTNCAFVVAKQLKLKDNGLPQKLARRVASLSEQPSHNTVVLVSDVFGRSNPQYALDIIEKFPHKLTTIESRRLNLHILLGKTFDVEEKRKELLPLAEKPKHKFDLLTALSLYLLLKKDLVKALDYFFEAVTILPTPSFSKDYKSLLFQKNVDLRKIFFNEVNLCLKKTRYAVGAKEIGSVTKAKSKLQALCRYHESSCSYGLLKNLLNPLIP